MALAHLAGRRPGSHTVLMRLRGLQRWSRTDWLVIVGVAGLAALFVRGALSGRGLHVPTSSAGIGELVLILVIVLLAAIAVSRRRG
jgi:hypothetical protein